GHAAHDVLALAAERGELAQPIIAGLPDLLAEAALAARLEQARSIGDVLLRRTRLGLLAARELLGDGGVLADGADGTAPVRRVAATSWPSAARRAGPTGRRSRPRRRSSGSCR